MDEQQKAIENYQEQLLAHQMQINNQNQRQEQECSLRPYASQTQTHISTNGQENLRGHLGAGGAGLNNIQRGVINQNERNTNAPANARVRGWDDIALLALEQILSIPRFFLLSLQLHL